MILFPVVNMPIFLVLRGLASRAHVSDNHGLLLTSTGLISVFGQQYHRNRWASITWPSLPHREHIPHVGDDLPELKRWTWTGATGNSVLPPRGVVRSRSLTRGEIVRAGRSRNVRASAVSRVAPSPRDAAGRSDARGVRHSPRSLAFSIGRCTGC